MELHFNVYKTLDEEIRNIKDSVKESNTKGIENGLDEMKQLTKMLLYNWEDDYYMAIATLAALRSKDPRTPVSSSFMITQGMGNAHAGFLCLPSSS